MTTHTTQKDISNQVGAVITELEKLQELTKGAINSYRYGEGRLQGGDFVNFTCLPELKPLIEEFLPLVRTVSRPVEHQSSTKHGAYVGYSRYKLKQHQYGASMTSFAEILSIEECPEGHHPVVSYVQTHNADSFFIEWQSVEDAKKSWSLACSIHTSEKDFNKCKGFIRKVVCGVLTPWFYALGDEKLVGDYCFPTYIQNDPVFRFGRKFLVVEKFNGVAGWMLGRSPYPRSVKTCMGCRLIPIKDSPGETEREVYFNDGTIIKKQELELYEVIRPLEDDELWIDDAVSQFKSMLLGNTDKVEVQFLDDTKFLGSFKNSTSKALQKSGQFNVAVHIKGRDEPRKGWTHVDNEYFEPTKEIPDIISYVKSRLKPEEVENVTNIEIIETRYPKGNKGKKWSGVLYKQPKTIKE